MKKLPGNLTVTVLMALLSVLVIVYFYPHTESNSLNYEQGRPWNYAKLIAPFDMEIYPDSATVQRLRDSLDSRYQPVYAIDRNLADSIIALLPAQPAQYHNMVADRLRQHYRHGVVDAPTRQRILDGQLPSVQLPDDVESNVLNTKMTEGLLSTVDVYRDIEATAKADTLARKYLSDAHLEQLLQPNITLNVEENKKVYESYLAQLEGARGVIQQGQTIIDKGMIISPQDYVNLQTYERKLEQLQTKQTRREWLVWTGQFLYVALLITALTVYLHYFTPKAFGSKRSTLFIYLMITLPFLLCIAARSALPGGMYLVPLAVVPVLFVVFFDSRTAIMASLTVTLLCAGVTTYTLEWILLQFCAALGVIISLRELRLRSQLLRTSLVVLVSYVVAYTSLELLMNGSFAGFSVRMLVFLAVNSALTSVIYAIMFLIERTFGFTSVVTLVELADINSPLLKRLSDECPGTFNHSLSVSNLAADAAQHIGANVALVRAGAMYHDIGKLKNPAFFTENQHGVNPHDTLTPEQSAKIITAHVTDGLKMAEKHGLPKVIKAFIREHHGKGMAKYFYITECNKNPGVEVDPAPYSYIGPNPQSKETSVLMMADAVEAASRSLREYTTESITDLVNKIVDGQLYDGLHHESSIEFRDIARIKQAFVKRLLTMYHTRITYPTANK